MPLSCSDPGLQLTARYAQQEQCGPRFTYTTPVEEPESTRFLKYASIKSGTRLLLLLFWSPKSTDKVLRHTHRSRILNARCDYREASEKFCA